MERLIINDEAVSETLGYILLFAISLTAIAIILLVGNTIIENEKSRDNFQNMEQSFAIIRSDLNQLALEGAPVKTARVHMEDGTLGFVSGAARIRVDYHNTHYDEYTGQIIFSQGRNLLNNISIENGGVWKAYGGYTYITSQPRMYVTPNTQTLVLNIYRMSSATPVTNAGVGTMNVEMRFNGTTVLPADSQAGGSASILIDTKYPEAWTEYLTNMAAGTGVTVSFTNYSQGVNATLVNVNQLIISEHRVNVSLSGLYV